MNLAADTAIKIGHIYVPYGALEEALASSVRPLIFGDEDGTGYYSKRGTCTLLNWRGGLFGFFTRHQLEGKVDLDRQSPENIRIPMNNLGEANFPLKTLFNASKTDQAEEIEDICGVEIAIDEIAGPHQKGFASAEPDQDRALPAQLYICAGCPTREGEIDYETPRINIETLTLPALQDQNFTTNVAWLKRLTLKNNVPEVPYDGMSGGAVFALRGNLRSFACTFEGIIVRGSNGFLHYIDAAFVRSLLIKSFTEHQE